MVSQHLPVSIQLADGKVRVDMREGGFAYGLHYFYCSQNCYWIGWPGIQQEDMTHEEQEALRIRLFDNHCLPIYYNDKQALDCSHYFSEKIIYPLFHYYTQNIVFDPTSWEGYKKINQLFADVLLNVINENDKIWIHDYQLMLLPGMLRKHFPNISIGFFLHIPFPSYEVFRLMPWRTELLESLLSSDLIGFHTYDYERHFISCVRRLLGYDAEFNQVRLEERIVKVDSYPMGVDYNRFHKAAEAIKERKRKDKSGIQNELDQLRNSHSEVKYVLSIDRLDESKGIPERLKAFEYFLRNYPSYLEKVIFLLVVIPTEDKDESYRKLKSDVDELVGMINGRYGTLNWTPIRYFYRSLDFQQLTELYTSSEIAFFTPFRDGMNLKAKQFVASKTDGRGVLILSEMAGASKEMYESLLVNPSNIREMADAIHKALSMPEEEQIERNNVLQERLKNYNEEKWVNFFIDGLRNAKQLQNTKLTKKVNQELQKELLKSYKKASKRIFFLDYDGTLSPFKKDPNEAGPDDELYNLLSQLTELPNTEVTIISGRNKEMLSEWFQDNWNIHFIAEHGVWIKSPGGKWEAMERINNKWKNIVRPYIEFYVDRTPGSFIEEKNYSLVWHYRKADPDLGKLRSWELKDELLDLVTNHNLEIMDGDKVIEIKNAGINKGRAALSKLGNNHYDFIFAIGDDWTDEYLFEALPDKAFTIKVGAKSTKAMYYVEGQEDVRPLLNQFTQIQQKAFK